MYVLRLRGDVLVLVPFRSSLYIRIKCSTLSFIWWYYYWYWCPYFDASNNWRAWWLLFLLLHSRLDIEWSLYCTVGLYSLLGLAYCPPFFLLSLTAPPAAGASVICWWFALHFYIAYVCCLLARPDFDYADELLRCLLADGASPHAEWWMVANIICALVL
jgi:hypothetical protein